MTCSKQHVKQAPFAYNPTSLRRMEFESQRKIIRMQRWEIVQPNNRVIPDFCVKALLHVKGLLNFSVFF